MLNSISQAIKADLNGSRCYVCLSCYCVVSVLPKAFLIQMPFQFTSSAALKTAFLKVFVVYNPSMHLQ